MDAGLDSMSGTAFVRIIAEQLGTWLPSTLIFDHPTIHALADYLSP